MPYSNNREIQSPSFQYEFFYHTSKMNAAKKIWSGFPLHWHPEYEIIVPISGSMDINIDGEIYKVKEGVAVFINSKSLHSMASVMTGDDKFWAIVFSENFLFPSVTDPVYEKYIIPLHKTYMKDYTKAFPVILGDTESWQKEIIDSLNNMRKTYLAFNKDDSGAGFELKVRSVLLSLFFEFIRHDAFITVCTAQSNKTEVVREVLQIIQNNFTENIKINQLAREMNSSPEYFCRYFKSLVGTSPKGYLLDYRLNEAKKQLQINESSITNIAYNCGFSDINYFSRLFKKKYDMTPKKYRTLFLKEIIN